MTGMILSGTLLYIFSSAKVNRFLEHKIADFSHHQGNVNWAAASKELDLAIIRVQYGSLTVDSKYKEYVSGCKDHGIPFAHYAYCRFVSVKDAIIKVEDFHKRADKAALFRGQPDTVSPALTVWYLAVGFAFAVQAA